MNEARRRTNRRSSPLKSASPAARMSPNASSNTGPPRAMVVECLQPRPDIDRPGSRRSNSPVSFTGADYHYRIKVKTANGKNPTLDNVLHTVAVLKAKTGDVSNLEPNTATLKGSPQSRRNADDLQIPVRPRQEQYDLETESQSAGSGTPDIPVDTDRHQQASARPDLSLSPGRRKRTREDKSGKTGPSRTGEASDLEPESHERASGKLG